MFDFYLVSLWLGELAKNILTAHTSLPNLSNFACSDFDLKQIKVEKKLSSILIALLCTTPCAVQTLKHSSKW